MKLDREARGDTTAASNARKAEEGQVRWARCDDARRARSRSEGWGSAEDCSLAEGEGHGGFMSQLQALLMQKVTRSRSSDGSQAS